MIVEEELDDEDGEAASPETTGVVVKCYYESDIRSITIPRDGPLRDLRALVAKTYALKDGNPAHLTSSQEHLNDPPSPSTDNFLIKYKDLEDDRITIRTEDDLRFALLIGMSAVKKLFIYPI